MSRLRSALAFIPATSRLAAGSGASARQAQASVASGAARAVSHYAALPAQADPSGLYINFKRAGRFASAAASFKPGGLLHTQLNFDDKVSQIVVRLSQLDPESHISSADALRPLYNALFPYFAGGRTAPESIEIELPLPSAALHGALMKLGAEELHPNYRITRAALFQLFQLATTSTAAPIFPYIPKNSHDSSFTHPLRPPKPTGTVYSRRVPHLDAFFKLETCTPNDIGLIHRWMNEPRVNEFWKEQGTWEAHESFLASRLDAPHVLPLVGSYIDVRSYNNVAFPPEEEALYAEVYWAKEAFGGKLGQEELSDYDRGIHALVGSNAHRGPHRVRAWLPSLVHYCFLDDPRTQRVVVEPNELNTKMIDYFASVGFVKKGTAQLANKTACVMTVDRNEFYKLCPF
ncbi:siderophore biosynthesis protein [Pseudohyphozyma bogoriensis]|nr:siderophore biosynthesis protein [Pseudohyphozyma bogoriensis]